MRRKGQVIADLNLVLSLQRICHSRDALAIMKISRNKSKAKRPEKIALQSSAKQPKILHPCNGSMLHPGSQRLVCFIQSSDEQSLDLDRGWR